VNAEEAEIIREGNGDDESERDDNDNDNDNDQDDVDSSSSASNTKNAFFKANSGMVAKRYPHDRINYRTVITRHNLLYLI
jgi:hypothetical protein